MSLNRAERKHRYAVRRRLCWHCFKPLIQNPTSYEFRCASCGQLYNADVIFQYEEKLGRC